MLSCFYLLKCGVKLQLPHKISKLKNYDCKSTSSYLDWYYCDPEAIRFPVRDVTTLGKFEPHYEDGSPAFPFSARLTTH